jgi:hypothetical protein
MARLIDQDFARLQIYLNEYSLADTLNSKAREQLIKRAHKNCLASLQLWAIAEHLISTRSFFILGTKVKPESVHIDLFSECFSDITSSFFSSLHGLYKPANMSLRSAIETFVRSIAGLYSKEAETTTSVYTLFELAKSCKPFLGASQTSFDVLHQQYILLCDHTHSATSAHMIQNHAMSNFPKQDINKLKTWVRHYELTINAILSICIFANPKLFLNAPPKAQDIYEAVIAKGPRLYALGSPQKD